MRHTLPPDDKPAFEVLDTDCKPVLRIWADGRVEGVSPHVVIINRIPALIAFAVMQDRALRTAA